jgi:hypothetical protein
MSNRPKISNYKTLRKLVDRVANDLADTHFALLYAYNGTGKTRVSMEFKERGKRRNNGDPDTLYFNAFTEDLFSWDNDLDNDTNRVLKFNSASKFFTGFQELALEEKIFTYLERYAQFDFKFDYDNSCVAFSQRVKNVRFRPDNERPEYITEENIKISRGEENIFIWCFFLAICELAIDDDGNGPYNWVRYFYIDDPISSLDDNNAIAVASDLAKLLKKGVGKIKTIISSHHSLFYNVMCNELKTYKHSKYFLYKNGQKGHTLQKTNDTPYFHHVAILSELKKAESSNVINTYHFNALRSILERTATFFGFEDFGKCIHGIDDDVLYERALNLLSHGKYSIYEPVAMSDDNKTLFKNILNAFLDKYQFHLPELLAETNQ